MGRFNNIFYYYIGENIGNFRYKFVLFSISIYLEFNGLCKYYVILLV